MGKTHYAPTKLGAQTEMIPDTIWSVRSYLSYGYVTLLEVTENFWRLSRTAKILRQNFQVTSVESRNHA